MKFVVLALAIALSGCMKSDPEEDARKRAEREAEHAKVIAVRARIIQDMATACDGNGGLAGVEDKFSSGKYRSYLGTVVTCNNGMSKIFDERV